MNILDDAFELAKSAYGNVHAEAKNKLQKKYPDKDWNDIVEVYTRARELAGACYDFGDRCLDKKLTDTEAISEMKEKHPGFSDSTYKSALSHGYFDAR